MPIPFRARLSGIFHTQGGNQDMKNAMFVAAGLLILAGIAPVQGAVYRVRSDVGSTPARLSSTRPLTVSKVDTANASDAEDAKKPAPSKTRPKDKDKTTPPPKDKERLVPPPT